MSLTANDRLNLIKDILRTHHLDGAASSSEYQQLYRTAQTLINDSNEQVTNANETLQAISDYSAKGMSLSGYDDHITENKDNLNSWLQTLNHNHPSKGWFAQRL
ncbi:Fic family protein [Pullulanibacillus pueri]|uniref:YtzH-like protein n=1 Tax=Pullulanibacillus pueri TaxID=1437324 RepID=A0A8J3A1E7_9BACL|nr:YtzH-like family protein [Pullulanibacillus pueri]MBM7684267.1 Fic family protein [Pullulanibacillus pueri]GGH89161.1 hypothetical protein GCM10007096_43120 [Pullulanibacillus pueri]